MCSIHTRTFPDNNAHSNSLYNNLFLDGFNSSPGWLLVTRTRRAWCRYRGHCRSGPRLFSPRSRVCAQEWHSEDIHAHKVTKQSTNTRAQKVLFSIKQASKQSNLQCHVQISYIIFHVHIKWGIYNNSIIIGVIKQATRTTIHFFTLCLTNSKIVYCHAFKNKSIFFSSFLVCVCCCCFFFFLFFFLSFFWIMLLVLLFSFFNLSCMQTYDLTFWIFWIMFLVLLFYFLNLSFMQTYDLTFSF